MSNPIKTTSAQVSATLLTHTRPLTQRTDAIISASKSIAVQTQTLNQETQKLARRAKELDKMMEQSVDRLKEMGDLQNWAEVVFRDVCVVEETLRMIEEGGGEDG